MINCNILYISRVLVKNILFLVKHDPLCCLRVLEYQVLKFQNVKIKENQRKMPYTRFC